MPKKTPAIGTPAFHMECNKVLQTMVEVLADRFTDGDESKLADYLSIGLITKCGDQKIEGDTIEGQAHVYGCAVFGGSPLLITLAGQIVQRIAEAKHEATGMPIQACVMELIGEVMTKASGALSVKDVKKGDPKSIEEALKQLLKDED